MTELSLYFGGLLVSFFLFLASDLDSVGEGFVEVTMAVVLAVVFE